MDKLRRQLDEATAKVTRYEEMMLTNYSEGVLRLYDSAVEQQKRYQGLFDKGMSLYLHSI